MMKKEKITSDDFWSIPYTGNEGQMVQCIMGCYFSASLKSH